MTMTKAMLVEQWHIPAAAFTPVNCAPSLVDDAWLLTGAARLEVQVNVDVLRAGDRLREFLADIECEIGIGTIELIELDENSEGVSPPNTYPNAFDRENPNPRHVASVARAERMIQRVLASLVISPGVLPPVRARTTIRPGAVVVRVGCSSVPPTSPMRFRGVDIRRVRMEP